MHGEDKVEILLEDIRRRDEKSFKRLFRLYFTSMTLFAEYFLMDREEAEDVVQDIFFQIWSNAENIPAVSNLKAYLFIQVRNRCLNSLKHLEVEDKYRQWMLHAQEYAEISDLSLDEELLEKVYAAIEELPSQAKIIFKRCILDGKMYKEVAAEMGLSVHTVNTQMKRSYKFLRSRLGVSYLLILSAVF